MSMSRAVGLVDPLPNGGEEHDGQGEAQAAGSAVDDAQQEAVALLDVYQHHAQDGAVGGDQIGRAHV